ncbi:MAG: glycosyltransferase family 39 protein [Chloroflexi bacterium]|nr:glycosyltransferase family 39 protein [Chloroflexota bacterium]
MTDRPRTSRTDLALLALVLATALFVRMQLFTGMVRGDDVHYAFAAYELSQGRTHFDVWEEGTARVGLYAPVALAYRLFGVSELSTVLFPLTASLGTVVLIFALGVMFSGPRAGLLAAMLWAVFPLDVFLATDLLPDGPMTFFCTAAMYCSFRAQRAAGWRGRLGWAGVSLASIGWGLSIKPLAAVAALFLIAWSARRGILWLAKRQWTWAAAGAVGLIYIFLQPPSFLSVLSSTAADFSSALLLGRINQPTGDGFGRETGVFFIWGLLFLAGFLHYIRQWQAGHLPLLAWAAFLFLYYEWGTISTEPALYYPLQDWVDGRNMLFVFPPFAVLAGVFLGETLRRVRLQALVPAWALMCWAATLLAAGRVNAESDPDWALGGGMLAWLLVWFSIGGDDRRPALRSGVGWALVLAIGVGSFAPAGPFSRSLYTDRRVLLDELVWAAGATPDRANLQVYTDAPDYQPRIAFAFDFELDFDWQGASGVLANHSLQPVSDWSEAGLPDGALLILFDPETRAPAGARAVVDASGKIPVSFRLYWFHSGAP